MKKIWFVSRENLPFLLWRSPIVEVETARRGEREGFAAQKRFQLTENPCEADVVFARNCPERTSDRQLRAIQRMIAKIDDGTRLVINPQSVFHVVDCKERTFSAWSQAGVACPRHWVLPAPSRDPLGFRAVAQVLEILDAVPRILLRTNNETGSNGLHIVERDTPRAHIRNLILWLRARAAVLKSIRKRTCVIAVEYIDARNSDGYATLGRAFVLLERVIGYFACVSNELEFRVHKMVPESFERFVEANKQLRRIIEDSSISSEIVRAVSTLGNNVGALDFLVRNGRPVFLELNPVWGGIPGPYAFGNEAFQGLLQRTEPYWSKELPNIVENLNVVEFYRNMYDYIGDYAETQHVQEAATGRQAGAPRQPTAACR